MRALFWYVIVPIGLIVGVVAGINAWGGADRTKKDQASNERLAAELETSDGYLRHKVTVKPKIYVFTPGYKVHMRGFVHNRGEKHIKNIRIKFAYLTTAKPGEERKETMDTGPIKPGERKGFDDFMFNGASPALHYTFTVTEVTL